MSFVRPGGIRILLYGAALLVLGSAGSSYWFYDTFLRDLPDLQSVADFRPPLASKVLDRDGQTIGEY